MSIILTDIIFWKIKYSSEYRMTANFLLILNTLVLKNYN